jgi:hypothetical protein
VIMYTDIIVLPKLNHSTSEKEKKTEFCIIGLIHVAAPDIKILAHDLQSVDGDKVSGVVECVLQNTFGIERNINENVFKARVNQSATLVQHRDDGSEYPVLSLEAAYCKGRFDDANVIVPKTLTVEYNAQVLLVGLSRSYHAAYTQADLSEMARMYWKLENSKIRRSPSF